MDDLGTRLNSSSPTTVAQIISRIYQTIKEQKADLKNNAELKFLRDKCSSPDPLISEVAGTCIISLVEESILPVESTLTDFITTIPLTKCYRTLIDILGYLLYFDIKNKFNSSKKYKNLYNISLPQHPYITLLVENPNAWNGIYNKIKYLHDNENWCLINELFRPVFLFSLCDPRQSSSSLLKQKLWTFLLVTDDRGKEIIYDVLCWLQIQTGNNIEMCSELLNEALAYASSNKNSALNLELLLLWQTSVLYCLAVNKCDLQPVICCLKNSLEKATKITTTNCLLLILSRTVDVCSPVYLKHLLSLCQLLILKEEPDIIVLETLKASLLQWLAAPCALTEEANKVANNVLTYIEHNKNYFPKSDACLKKFQNEFRNQINTNNHVFITIEICIRLEDFEDENDILEWLEEVSSVPDYFIIDIFHFLCGLLLVRPFSSDIFRKVFFIVLQYVENNMNLSPKLLTLILYKLSNTTDQNVHYALLKSLPKMVALRENIPKVMATLQALSRGSVNLYNLSLSLVYDAWKTDHKCYSYLESMLTQGGFNKKKWERYVLKTYILKELCHERPELYGKDMVPHLSNVLNECNDDDGSLPCSLALEGIKNLCRAEVIDIVTTWNTLSPKFKNDTRIPVVKSLCLLIQEIPQLSYMQAYSDLYEELVQNLWNYVEFGDPEISEAALNALTFFGLEHISAHIPEQYLEEDISHAGATPQLIPGKTWINFLTLKGASPAAIKFIIKMVSIEINGYLKFVYKVKGSKEPLSYGYLSSHSILRGIGEFIRTWAHKWRGSIHDKLYIDCLRILSQEYSKPLPPLDWCFLQELIHDPRTKTYSIDIASHQVILSGTARRLMENYMIAITSTSQEEDIMILFRNLKHLANSIQPTILKPFLETAIHFAIARYTNEGSINLLENMSRFIRNVLQNPDIQETNKSTIGQVLSDTIFAADMNRELFDTLLHCVIALPTRIIEEMTSLKSINFEEALLEKVMKIRFFIAGNINNSPLNWLNDMIHIDSTIGRKSSYLEEYSKVFRKHADNSEDCAFWLLDLIGQMQAKVADRCDQSEVCRYLDIFILAVTEFSGYRVFIKESEDGILKMRNTFPQAFASLLSREKWSVCTIQALEWLYHMNTKESLPIKYRNIFGIALQALRHDDEFLKNQKWMKYMNSRVDSVE